MPDDDLLAGHDVVDQVRVHRGGRLIGARLDRGDEAHQRSTVIAFRKALAVHDLSTRQLGVRVQESVGGHQVDARMVAEPGEQRLQHTGSGRLADGDAAGHADDERHRPVRALLGLAEELGSGREEALPGGDLQVDQTGQRQIDLFDFQQVELLAHTAQTQQFMSSEFQGSRHTQCAPLAPVELDVGTRLARPRHAPSLAVIAAR